MNAKILLLCLIALVAIKSTWSLGSSNCPTASRIDSCSPKCKDNSNCHGAQVCCTNICGTKSCTDIYQYQDKNKGSNSKYSSNSKGATGSYCGNTKCGPSEKCELDRTTKREKCVRG
ncbi:waprin-Thr1 isoform X1 [Tribolium madens]|uniref:waprin-Thr1 isoform X1 n=1 Tax=Tribolium madens TaxID=41895 RepID=UPI001CF76537|nr:waprin-Thr1 isoform X1 [Tribolium madens]